MGQKVHPVGFRLGVIKDWQSKWYADKAYTGQLHEDLKVRRMLMKRLMDAGVPIKAPVGGIAMGLLQEGDEVVILSDILGDEDHAGGVIIDKDKNTLWVPYDNLKLKAEGEKPVGLNSYAAIPKFYYNVTLIANDIKDKMEAIELAKKYDKENI